MEKEISDLLGRVKYLEDVTNFNQQNLILTWTILGVIVAGLALSGFFYIRKWVDDKTDKEIEKIKVELLSKATDYRIIKALRSASISGVQIMGYNPEIHALIINAYFEDEERTYNCKFIKDTLMYTIKDVSNNEIKIVCPNGSTSKVRVKRLVEDGFELEWITEGEVADVNIALDIMIL